MGSIPASTNYVTGWRTRHGGSTWSPSSSTWADTNASTGYTYATASNPSGTNKYTIILKIHTPSNSDIKTVDSVTVAFKMYKSNSTSGTLYGSLRTKVSDLGSSDTDSTYRSYAIGSEASATFGSTSYTSISMTFNGTMSPNTDYYLVLYSKSNSDMFFAKANDWTGSTGGRPTASFTYTEPVTHFFWYFDEYQGSSSFNSQTVTDGGDLQLLGALDDQSGVTYEVSYNANGGSTTPTVSNSTSTITHTYWEDDYGNQYSPGSWLYDVTEGSAMYAVYEESRKAVTLASAISRGNGTAKRTVTFDANGGTCSTTSLDSTATITYTFNKWADGSTSGTEYNAEASFTPSDNTTMYATWTDSTGNYSAITLPTPTRTGYNFKGWATSSTATSGSTGSYTPTDDVTLYATWALKTYTISYDANGHGSAPNSQTKTHGTNLTLQPFISNQTGTGYTVNFDKNGGTSTPNSLTSNLTYSQTYWNTNSNGNGTNYSSQGSYSTEASDTLYAIWKTTNGSVTLPTAISRSNSTGTGYTVTFNANGGTCATSQLTSTLTYKYTFNKWALNSIDGTQYSAGASFAPTTDVTMYATWTTAITNGSIALPTPTRTGYTFKGWAENTAASSGLTGAYTPKKDLTLYAIWQANTWTITYDANGYGTAPTAQTKTYGQTLILQEFMADQTTTGYTVSFNKNEGDSTPTSLTSRLTKKQTYWNTEPDGTGTNYASGGSFTRNETITLYAIWGETVNGAVSLPNAISKNNKVDEYTITYYNNEDSIQNSENCIRTTTYTFNGWAEGSVSGTKYGAGAAYTPTGNTTMYATWRSSGPTGTIVIDDGLTKANTTQNGYTVTFDANGGSSNVVNLTATDTVKYTFDEWNTKSSGAGTGYKAGSTQSFDSNINLYPIYTSSITKGSINLPTPTRTNYEFMGWAPSTSASSGVTGTYKPEQNITFYAIWSMTNSIIHYNNNGTDTHCSVYYNNNGSAILCNVYYNNNGTAVRI